MVGLEPPQLPQSIPGQILELCASGLGVCLLAVLIAVISEKLELRTAEARVVEYLNDDLATRRARRVAVLVIQNVWRSYVAAKRAARRRARMNGTSDARDHTWTGPKHTGHGRSRYEQDRRESRSWAWHRHPCGRICHGQRNSTVYPGSSQKVRKEPMQCISVAAACCRSEYRAHSNLTSERHLSTRVLCWLCKYRSASPRLSRLRCAAGVMRGFKVTAIPKRMTTCTVYRKMSWI